MPQPEFIKARRKARKESSDWYCWGGHHRVGHAAITVEHAKRRGICRRCVYQRSVVNGTFDLASYWTKDWPRHSIGPIGKRSAR